MLSDHIHTEPLAVERRRKAYCDDALPTEKKSLFLPLVADCSAKDQLARVAGSFEAKCVKASIATAELQARPIVQQRHAHRAILTHDHLAGDRVVLSIEIKDNISCASADDFSGKSKENAGSLGDSDRNASGLTRFRGAG